MVLKLWLCTASFLGPIVVVNSACNNTPRPAGCQANNNQFAKDMDVYPPSAVNCSFAGNLCCYRQGCFDFDMGNWSASNGSASVKQYSEGCGVNSYSVLESPWVIVSTPSCVEFAYSIHLPYRIQVFLAFRNGTPPLMKGDSQRDQQLTTARFDIEHLTGKIQFRCQGGGGVNVQPLKLFYVRITEGRCQTNALPLHPEVSDPSSCDVLTTTAPTTVHTTPSTKTHLTPPSTAAPTTVHTTSSTKIHLSSSSTDASTSSQPPSTRKTTEMTVGDRDSDSNVGVIVGVSVAAVAAVVVFVIILIAYRRKVHARDRSGSDGPRGQAVYENQGFHDQPARHPVVDSSRVNPRDLSDHRDSARRSDSINDYVMPMNVYDSLANRNIEQNPYDALANQNNTYEGLSQNRNENRTYESLVASRGQNEDYEIPDTTSNNDTRLAEVNKNCCEYYNQPRPKKSGISSPSQAVSLSQVSEYQNIKT